MPRYQSKLFYLSYILGLKERYLSHIKGPPYKQSFHNLSANKYLENYVDTKILFLDSCSASKRITSLGLNNKQYLRYQRFAHLSPI